MNKVTEHDHKLRIYFQLIKFMHFRRLQLIIVKEGHTKIGKPNKYKFYRCAGVLSKEGIET